MTREEPSLETLWLQNIRLMDKVQIIDRSNTAPSSKTFRDEFRVNGLAVSQCDAWPAGLSVSRNTQSIRLIRRQTQDHFTRLCISSQPDNG
jgi:hypothetical protein